MLENAALAFFLTSAAAALSSSDTSIGNSDTCSSGEGRDDVVELGEDGTEPDTELMFRYFMVQGVVLGIWK